MTHQEQLKRPFSDDRIEWRLQSCGKNSKGFWAKCLAYIDNRGVMERLDEVYGDGWSQSEKFMEVAGKGVCVVTIDIHNQPEAGIIARTVTGVCEVEANGDIDPFKTAASGAMKRAVVNLGIGRYLYDLHENWAEITENGRYTGSTRDKEHFRWNPPQLPDWAKGDGKPYVREANHKQASQPSESPAPKQKSKPTPVAELKADKPVDMSHPYADVKFTFGKMAGKSLGEIVASKEGRNYLEWYVKQPVKDGPYKAKNEEFINKCVAILEGGSTPEPEPVTSTDDVPF